MFVFVALPISPPTSVELGAETSLVLLPFDTMLPPEATPIRPPKPLPGMASITEPDAETFVTAPPASNPTRPPMELVPLTIPVALLLLIVPEEVW